MMHLMFFNPKQSLDSKKLNLMQLMELSGETKEMMENSRKEYAEGHVIAFNSASEAQKWMEML